LRYNPSTSCFGVNITIVLFAIFSSLKNQFEAKLIPNDAVLQ